MTFLPPTDSFYKFLAVGGLILFLTGVFSIFKGDDKEQELFVRQQGEERILQKEINILVEELKYNKKYKKLIDSIGNGSVRFLNVYKDTIKGKDSIYQDSLLKEIVYNMPDSIQDKYERLMIKKEELANNLDFINNHKSTHESYFIPYLIALYLGEFIAIFGFGFWYYKIQKPIDDVHQQKETQKLLQGEYWEQNCQSCLKTFFFIDERGTEKNGSLSKLFCKECYSQGSFIEPTLTIDEASVRLKTKLTDLKYKERKIAKNLKILRKALRWKRSILW